MNQKELLKARGICVVVPTYNNIKTISDVIKATLEQCDDVIVVSDGSDDGTTEALTAYGSAITLISYGRNRGKGYALKVGFRKALELGFVYAITLDGDGQHYPTDIPLFLKANQEHPEALLLGSRRLEGVERSKGSSFANRFSNFWFRIQTGVNAPDTQTGYRLYPLRKLHGLGLLTARYEAELELLVFASWHGTPLVSVPVNVYYPPREERVSHFRPTADFMRITALNCVLCFLAVVYGLPLRIWRWLMKWVRTIYSLLFFSFSSFVMFTPAVWLYIKIGKMTERKRFNIHRLIYHATRFLMFKHGIPGTKFTYHVDEKVNFDQPSVIICNHQSHLDLVCQLIFTPKIVFLTNNWVYHNAFYGLLIRNAEYLPVVDGLGSLMPQLRSLAKRGYSIAVFPEGTRSKDCSIGRFHQGAFYIAQELGLPVLPMLLYGPGRVLKKKTYHLNQSPIHVEVGAPISQEELKAMGDLRHQANTLRHIYEERYADLCNRMVFRGL